MSLVAPGKDGYYMKRQPLRPEEISSMIVQTVKKNERDRVTHIESTDNRTISSMFNLGRRN